MKDKNQLIGWLLMGLVMIGYMTYSSYTAKENYAQQIIQDSINNVIAEQEAIKVKEAEAKKAAQANDSTNVLFCARHGKEETCVIENSKLKVTLSTKGGQVLRAELKDPIYRNQQGGAVVLFDEGDSEMKFYFDGKSENIVTNDFYFTAKDVSESAAVMSLPVGDGEIRIEYSLLPESYILKMNVSAQNLSGFFASDTKKFDIKWTEKIRQQEKGYSFESRYSTITYRNTDDDTDELSSSGADKEMDSDDFEDEKLKWVSFKTQFFNQTLVADGSFGVTSMSSKAMEEGSGYLKEYTTELSAKFDPATGEGARMHLFLGPNKFSELKANEKLIDEDSNLNLQSIVYLGWPILRWINRFIFLPLFDVLTSFGMNMGIVLLIITIIVKFAVFPLQKKSYLSSARMRVLKPKVDEINAKYPKQEDAMRKQQEVMQLYSQYGVSPMGGCLPMVIQMPIWIALFNFIPNAIELRGQSFLWAADLSCYDDLIHWTQPDIWGISWLSSLFGNHLSLFCVLWCVSMIFNTKISMRQQQDSALMSPEQAQSMKMMKWFSYLMPVMFFFSFNGYASGLTYYYFVSGILSILMMWYLRKTTDDAKLLAQLEQRFQQRKNNPRKVSSMFEKMNALAEKQQEILRQQQEEARRRNEK